MKLATCSIQIIYKVSTVFVCKLYWSNFQFEVIHIFMQHYILVELHNMYSILTWMNEKIWYSSIDNDVTLHGKLMNIFGEHNRQIYTSNTPLLSYKSILLTLYSHTRLNLCQPFWSFNYPWCFHISSMSIVTRSTCAGQTHWSNCNIDATSKIYDS